MGHLHALRSRTAPRRTVHSSAFWLLRGHVLAVGHRAHNDGCMHRQIELARAGIDLAATC
jgi:hypothetical protein